MNMRIMMMVGMVWFVVGVDGVLADEGGQRGGDARPKLAPGEEKRQEAYLVARGGRAYDNWMGLLPEEQRMGLGLRGKHLAYPPGGKQKGVVTWRCKECHGWDYRGHEGEFGKGDHATGIKGIQGMAGGDPEAVKKILRDGNHGYTEAMIDAGTLEDLALFVTRGQVDMGKIVDPASGKSLGDAERGAPIYQTICALCHGVDGKRINFAPSPEEEYVGTVARESPWEALHKVRNGQPGERMVTVRSMSEQQQADLLSYLQKLP